MEHPAHTLIAYIRAESSREHWRAQATAIRAYAARHGLEVERTVVESPHPAGPWPPAHLTDTLDLLSRGSGLVVAELQAIVRHAAEVDELTRRLDAAGGYLVCVTEAIDTGTHERRKAFDHFRTGARWAASAADARLNEFQRRAREAERRSRLAGQREGDRLAVERMARELRARIRTGQARARAEGKPVGRRALADLPELEGRIHAMLERGVSRSEVARVLNAEGVPPVRGGRRWWPASIPPLETLEARRTRRRSAVRS